MISGQCVNCSVARFAAVTSPLRSSPAFAGFPHYTAQLAIFPELKLLPFLARFCDYTMTLYDVIKSSAHLASCVLSGVAQHSWSYLLPSGFQARLWKDRCLAEQQNLKGFLTET